MQVRSLCLIFAKVNVCLSGCCCSFWNNYWQYRGIIGVPDPTILSSFLFNRKPRRENLFLLKRKPCSRSTCHNDEKNDVDDGLRWFYYYCNCKKGNVLKLAVQKLRKNFRQVTYKYSLILRQRRVPVKAMWFCWISVLARCTSSGATMHNWHYSRNNNGYVEWTFLTDYNN